MEGRRDLVFDWMTSREISLYMSEFKKDSECSVDHLENIVFRFGSHKICNHFPLSRGVLYGKDNWCKVSRSNSNTGYST